LYFLFWISRGSELIGSLIKNLSLRGALGRRDWTPVRARLEMTSFALFSTARQVGVDFKTGGIEFGWFSVGEGALETDIAFGDVDAAGLDDFGCAGEGALEVA
jgi:hypothetical protein